MDRAHFSIGVGDQKPEQLMLAFNRFGLRATPSGQGVQTAAKSASARSSSNANQVGVLRCLVSAYSQKELNGAT
jgi:hypothetical protein